ACRHDGGARKSGGECDGAPGGTRGGGADTRHSRDGGRRLRAAGAAGPIPRAWRLSRGLQWREISSRTADQWTAAGLESADPGRLAQRLAAPVARATHESIEGGRYRL